MVAHMTRRERERSRHRREILAAATDVFARKGFDQTTMAEIAERAEFAVGTLYRFFKDKETLYQAIILDVAQQAEQTLQAAIETPGIEVEKLGRYIEAKVHVLLQHLPTAHLYFTHATSTRLSPLMAFEAEVRTMHNKLLANLESVIHSGIRKGILLDIDPRALTLGLEAISNSFIPELLERPDAWSGVDLAALIKRVFFDRVSLLPRPGSKTKTQHKTRRVKVLG